MAILRRSVLSDPLAILFSMEAIFAAEELEAAREARWREEEQRVNELASLSAHVSAATARPVELAWELRSTPAAAILRCRLLVLALDAPRGGYTIEDDRRRRAPSANTLHDTLHP
jgi:hypothetical protein